MLNITSKHKVFLAVKPIDFRKGIDSLVALCLQQFYLNPQTGHFFLFKNKSASSLKILHFDAQGYWLCHKRLSKGRFQHWPQHPATVLSLTPAQCQVLLSNGDPLSVTTAEEWKTILT